MHNINIKNKYTLFVYTRMDDIIINYKILSTEHGGHHSTHHIGAVPRSIYEAHFHEGALRSLSQEPCDEMFKLRHRAG